MLFQVLYTYLLLINVIVFLLFGYDKYQAKKRRQRVAEKNLFWGSALGGALGALLGMYFFRHKTRRASFVWGVPLLLLLHISLLGYMLLTTN